jgi:probable F420-dependent oxidoreductase
MGADHYQFTLINDAFNPGPISNPEIPIYLAGVNERMCRAAGEVADGFHVHPMHSTGYLRDVVRPAIDDGAKNRGLSVDDLSLHASVFAIVGDTQAERLKSEEIVRRQVAFYASTPSYRALLRYHEVEEVGRKLSQHMRQGEIAAMPALVPDVLMDAVTVTAKRTDLPALLRERYDGLLQRVALYYPVPSNDAAAPWADFTAEFRQAAE